MREPACEAAAFPHEQLLDAVDALAVAAGLASAPAAAGPRPPRPVTPDEVADSLARAGLRHGVELEEVELAGPRRARLAQLRLVGPGLIQLPGTPPRWLAVLDAGRRTARVVDADRRVRRVPLAALDRALASPADRDRAEVDQVVASAGLAGRAARRAARRLTVERQARTPVGGLWLVRTPPARPFLAQLRRAGLIRRAALLVAVHFAASILWLLSWWLVGRIAMDGVVEPDWMAAWVICVASLVPARAIVGWQQNILALEVGALLRRRLLAGALAIDGDRIKRDGLGRMLGLVLECDDLDALGTTGAILVLMAVVELVPAPWALAAGAGGAGHALLLALWLVPVAAVLWRQLRLRARWTERRLALTHDLVESMVGHRTRLAQQPRDRWHEAEDRAVDEYLAASSRYDRGRVALLHLLARGWLVAAVAFVVPAVAAGATASAIAVAIGASLYCYGAFDRLASGIERTTAALDAWRRVAPLFHGARQASAGPAGEVPLSRALPAGAPLLEAHGVSFGYPGRGQPVLRDLELSIRAGDRILVDGRSGSGKSTLAALLAAQRRPDTGLVLLHQLDVGTVGAVDWRRRVALVPQFHDNHVLAETFLFNLLMARRWPPTEADVDEATRVCGELGLDRVLSAMPAGMAQVIGETGWSLSHGERSRLFLARALLQEPDVLVLDESFAALDPELLDQVGRAVLSRSRTLVVIAHP